MHPLEVYELNQAGRDLTTPGIGPTYSAALYVQHGHGIGNFIGRLFRWVRPLLWSGPKQWFAGCSYRCQDPYGRNDYRGNSV